MIQATFFMAISARAKSIETRQRWSLSDFVFSAGCNSQSEIYNLRSLTGVLAQLVERLNGIEEVTGSNPVGSTYIAHSPPSLLKKMAASSGSRW
jgi:hypothetical protein